MELSADDAALFDEIPPEVTPQGAAVAAANGVPAFDPLPPARTKKLAINFEPGADLGSATGQIPDSDPEVAALEAQIAAKKKAAADKKAAAVAAQAAADAAALAEAAKAVKKCALCSVVLDPTNSSTLTSGLVKHIGCPKASVPVVPTDAPASDPKLASEQPSAPASPKQRKPKVEAAGPQAEAAAVDGAKVVPVAHQPAGGVITVTGTLAELRALFAR